MFYSTNVLQKKGPLGTIWIAAHHDVAKRLTKLQILNTDIVKTAGQIENPETQMSLRLSSHLLAGLSRIFTRKVQFLFTDCNEALSKITLAFRPSNVDLGPVNKAQIKSITIDENALIQMDLDLDLDLDDAEWLAPQALTSQGSAAEITLPETGNRKRSAASTFDDEDALLGSGWGAGDNPLDLAFEDAEVPRMDDLDEAPEKHRSSDQVPLADISKPQEDLEIPEALDMPDFDMENEIPLARPSDVQSVSLPATPGLKSLDESSVLVDKSPAIGVKKAVVKQVAKKRKPVVLLNQSTEIPKDEMRRWIMKPESASDLVRAPRPLPMNRQEEQKLYYDELRRKGQLADVMIAQPLVGFTSECLRKSLFDTDSGDRDGASKKRKHREEDQEAIEAQLFNDDLDLAPPDFGDAGAGWAEDAPVDDVERSAVSEAPASDRRSAGPGIFDQGVEEERDEEEDEEPKEKAKTTEQHERTKKVVLMLQKHFKGVSSHSALRFHAMIRTEPSAPVSRHTAAVAFFECLGLHAHGAVELQQVTPYGDLLIASTPSLATFKVKVPG